MKAKQQAPLETLDHFLPIGSFEAISSYLHQYNVNLTITRNRQTVQGDYKYSSIDKQHRISINGDLNPYAFLITLLHEIAHLLCYQQYHNRVSPHGKEWKQIYASLLSTFIQFNLFPNEIKIVLEQSLQNPAASSCGEPELIKVLRKYDQQQSKYNEHVENLLEGTLFATPDGRIFKRGKKMRKRIKCTLLKNGQMYLFSPVYQVQLVDSL